MEAIFVLWTYTHPMDGNTKTDNTCPISCTLSGQRQASQIRQTQTTDQTITQGIMMLRRAVATHGKALANQATRNFTKAGE